MTILILYENKEKKIQSDDLRETDLVELKSFGKYAAGSHEEFLKLPSTKIGNKTILEWFKFDDFSYWWFIAPIISPKFNETAYFVDNLINYIDTYSIHLIELKTAFDKLNIIKKICQGKNIQLKFSKSQELFHKIKYYFKNSAKKLAYKKITAGKHKKRLKLFQEKKKFLTIPKNAVLFTTHALYRRDTIDENGNISRQEFFIQPILDLLSQKNIPILCIDFDYTFHGETDKLNERLESQYNWLPVEYLLTQPKNKKVKKILKTLQNSVKDLLKLKNNFCYSTYKNIPILDFLGDSFDEIFLEPNLPTYIHLEAVAQEFLKKYKPRAIVQVYEHGPFAKAFELAAKKTATKTIGIQHGLFTETTNDYMFKETRNPQNLLGNPIPDLTCVYGEYFKKILTENGNYPKDKVAVIGNPTFYNFERKKQMLNKQKILNKYGFQDSKIILVPLARSLISISKVNYDYILLQILFEQFKEKDDIIILVRGHPGESITKKLLDKYFPGNNFQLSKLSLFEDIFISDIIVTSTSTVGIDATIFEKPVIFVNVTKTRMFIGDFQQNMVQNKTAIICQKEDIIQTIYSLLEGKIWNKDDDSYRKLFLQNFFNYSKEVDLMKLIFGS